MTNKKKTYTIIPPKEDELTPGGFTNRIKIKEGVTAKQLLEYGFTNHNKPILYYIEMVGHNISFNLSIKKETLEIEGIDVLDEDFLQPYDYQAILREANFNSTARGVFNKVDKIFKKLQNDGIIVGYERGMYI